MPKISSAVPAAATEPTSTGTSDLDEGCSGTNNEVGPWVGSKLGGPTGGVSVGTTGLCDGAGVGDVDGEYEGLCVIVVGYNVGTDVGLLRCTVGTDVGVYVPGSKGSIGSGAGLRSVHVSVRSRTSG